ncbi:hypothetical protein CDD82_6816 [Ophiocordyceps australis]|uniref:NADPH-dependent diflavin oxidoreductase 1 n=1 Tax=Ophiocordyceps australis TaxID=1399860 RepID=A0A2C5XFX9_9HYPO|nr:hypothetical protein CDD82_6816 [Ophiocordyceps australis]
MDASSRSALVLYGSETGNAQDMAQEVGQRLQRLRFKSRVDELNAVELSALLDHSLVVFVISTTGQGDVPHNASVFWKKLLRRKLPPTCLEKLRFTCLGLGDSSYLKSVAPTPSQLASCLLTLVLSRFNWAARKLLRRLELLGATPFMEPCEADEHIYGTFVRWLDNLKTHLDEHYPLPPGLVPIPDEVNLPPRWSLEPALRRLQDQDANHDTPQHALSAIQPIPDSWTATLVADKRLTPQSHWQDVRLLSFDVASRPSQPNEPLRCHPGDCLTIYPKNLADNAQRLIDLMAWQSVADQPLHLSLCHDLPRALYPPSPCTLRGLLIHCIDLTAVPSRSFLKSLSYFCSDAHHRQRLAEFSTLDFLDEYFDYATRSRRTIIEVLDDFPSVRVPPLRLLDVFPLIRGRDFSIANGGDAMPIEPDSQSQSTPTRATRVELLIALVRYRTILRKPRLGLCSHYLAHLPPGASLCVSYKPALSPVYGPDNARRPLVAMATGTGVAPVRSLLHERATYAHAAPALLFFGCRNRTADFFFAHEWRALASSAQQDHGVNTDPLLHAVDVDMDQETTQPHESLRVFAAFSRDQPQKVYVQDLVRKEAPRIASLMPLCPIFVICGGSSKMADACRSAVWDGYLAPDPASNLDNAATIERQRLLAQATWWQETW